VAKKFLIIAPINSTQPWNT